MKSVRVANGFFSEGDYDRAVTHYKKCIDANPGLSIYYFNLALALKKLGHSAEASAYFHKVKILQQGLRRKDQRFCGLSYTDAYELLAKNPTRFHKRWYSQKYSKYLNGKEDPIAHYLRVGASFGLQPRSDFDANFYLKSNPDIGDYVNPLVHHLLFGRTEGRQINPYKAALKEVEILKNKLLTFGFTERPLQELEQLVEHSPNFATQALAARELALWRAREKTAEGYVKAVEYLNYARAVANLPSEFYEKLNTMELLCNYLSGRHAEGRAFYERLVDSGTVAPDTMLAWANYQITPEERCLIVNEVLQHYGIPLLKLLPDGEASPYDRLSAKDRLPQIEGSDHPTVSVLVAVYAGSETIKTTLRALQEQTWKNLEIIVIDDCSPDNTRTVVEQFAMHDSRIRLITMERNGGAYVARNAGLDVATGDYITIHDADDWSHPVKIETQVKYLEQHRDVVGCTSQQARAYSDLSFTRWTGSGHYIINNISSFMFRAVPMRERLGYWDTARFSADNELIRRMKAVFGRRAVVELQTGPLSFQRDSDTSIVADETLGINGFLFGARKEYFDAQKFFHERAKSLKYDGKTRRPAFPIPTIMRADRSELKDRLYFDVIIASEFRMDGGNVHSCVQEIRAAKRSGLTVGVFEMHRYDLGARTRGSMLPLVRAEIDGDRVRVLTFGEEVSCGVLVLRYPPILQERQRYLPKVHASSIRVVINQPPVSDYSDKGVKRYDIKRCAENLRYYFGRDAIWHPNGPMVREALETYHREDLRHIMLSPHNWDNIIHVPEWKRKPRNRGPSDKLRIGRHSRDSYVKWPSSRQAILRAYPDAEDVEVHILGGAKTPSEIVGYTPRNWSVYEFGSIDPKDFLAKIDVFIFFAHPDWVESFPRTVLEAMAVGVPVILPHSHKKLFGDNALYATPETAFDVAKQLYKNPNEYDFQVQKAWSYLERHYSYSMHYHRIVKAKRNLDEQL